MNQNVLWHDTIYDALGADISAAGGFKVVAGKLWPTESPSTAATKLRNAINPDQAQKLCPEEVLAIKRLAKTVFSHATVDYEARELAFDVKWIQPEDELTRRLREHNKLTEELLRSGRELKDIIANGHQLRAIK